MSWMRPRLKRGVDLQLQTAFDDGQWASVIRLAEKRFRTFNDPYFEVSFSHVPLPGTLSPSHMTDEL